VIIIAVGASNLGLPIFSLVAGLGVGGLAVALAVRPTLENLIGGIVLFADKPVRVGDFCTFGAYMGTVESIGLRSTQIRALDRTLIAIPNAKLADMEITNWARCDRMLIHQFFTLRFETTPDQLRFTLARVREMFHAHPRIDPDTIRVRFVAYEESGLKIEIRVYAITREWNDFFAITEDVLLRINAIVDEAGTGFARPSRTLYVTRDKGLDEDRTKASTDRVRTWRRTGKLPFPRLSAQRMHELEGTLDYPPRGSVETWAGGTPPEEAPVSGEFLSAVPETDREREREEERR
jgi:MscS family membrane protein